MKINLSNACSYNNHSSTGCISKPTVDLMLSSKVNPKLIEKLRKGFGTIDELNVLLDPTVIEVIGEDKVEEELANFKPVGPITNQVFSNFHEDNILRHFANFDSTFYPCEVQLMDFPEPHYKFSRDLTDFLANHTPDRKGIKTMGCVLNTLRSDGSLSKMGHWVAMFTDFKTIEYFNSSGRSAPPEVWKWMEDFATKIGGKAVNVSNVVHQSSDTECGAYAIYYISARLLGFPYKKFREKKIEDSIVFKFRSFALNSIDKIKNKKFLSDRRLV